MIAIATLLIVILVSLLVTRVASVALILTGVTPDVARFQARSALSSTGFASTETEQITSHPARRRIIMSLMLIGNAGLVTTVASLSLSFGTASTASGVLGRLGILVVGLAVLVALARNRWVSAWVTRVAERVLRRHTQLDVRDYVGLLHLGGDYAVDRIRLVEEEWLTGQTLAESQLSAEGVVVLGIERADGSFVGAPNGTTRMEAGDTLLAYGSGVCLAELANRPAGPEGQAAHAANVAANVARVAAEQARDQSRRGRRSRR